MRRADRLFQIIDQLRRQPQLTAAELGRLLAVNTATIDRDVTDLRRCGVPLEGSAEGGYWLRPNAAPDSAGPDDALLAELVAGWPDHDLAWAAGHALVKATGQEPLLGELRQAVADRHPIRFATSAGWVNPLGLLHWGECWTLIVWRSSEVSAGFYQYRLDQIAGLNVSAERFDPAPGRTLDDFLRALTPAGPPACH